MCSGSKSSKEKLTSRAEAIHRKSVERGFWKGPRIRVRGESRILELEYCPRGAECLCDVSLDLRGDSYWCSQILRPRKILNLQHFHLSNPDIRPRVPTIIPKGPPVRILG